MSDTTQAVSAQFGGCGAAPAEISVMFVAQAAISAGASLPGARRRGPR